MLLAENVTVALEMNTSNVLAGAEPSLTTLLNHISSPAAIAVPLKLDVVKEMVAYTGMAKASSPKLASVDQENDNNSSFRLFREDTAEFINHLRENQIAPTVSTSQVPWIDVGLSRVTICKATICRAIGGYVAIVIKTRFRMNAQKLA